MRKYYIKTFWCSMNQADSEKINMLLLQSWFFKVWSIKDADLVIFNTCSVRQKWENRVFWMINEIVKSNKNNGENKIVWITWCMVRKTWINKKYYNLERDRKTAKKITILWWEWDIFNSDDKLFPKIESLDFTLRIEEVWYLSFILSHIFREKIGQDDKFDDYLKLSQLRENKYSANIIIQTGCDNYCTFCIVPYTRWVEISRPVEDILNEIKLAVKWWAKEINLIWQNVNSYWKQFIDKKHWNSDKSSWNSWVWISPFRDLLNNIDKINWIERIRFTSSNPHDMTRDILESHFELNHTCNYLHFALQSWSNEILKKMNRKHSYEDFKSQVDYLRSKDQMFSISTDIIVWFSWETEKDFKQTLKAFKECEFDFAYNARYSVRKGTIASKMYPDDISDEIKAKRWHILNNQLLENITKRNRMMLDNIEDVLIYWEKDWYFYWRTRNFKEVFFTKNDKSQIWDIVKVKIKKLDKYVLQWEYII